MVTNRQVRILMKAVKTEKSLDVAAAKAGMDAKTARKYRRSGKLPSEMKQHHSWRTRPDPFVEVWEAIRLMLEDNAGFEAKTLFEDLQRHSSHPFPHRDGPPNSPALDAHNREMAFTPTGLLSFAQQIEHRHPL